MTAGNIPAGVSIRFKAYFAAAGHCRSLRSLFVYLVDI